MVGGCTVKRQKEKKTKQRKKKKRRTHGGRCGEKDAFHFFLFFFFFEGFIFSEMKHDSFFSFFCECNGDNSEGPASWFFLKKQPLNFCRF